MTQVNPPPRLRIPQSLARDPQSREFLEQVNIILFQLWTRTGGSEDTVEIDRERIKELEDQVGENFNSYVQYLFKQQEEQPEFTMDTTGFTWDSSKITFDKVVA